MISRPVILLALALIAAVLGFGFLTGTAAIIAQILFGVFLVSFLVVLLTGNKRRL